MKRIIALTLLISANCAYGMSNLAWLNPFKAPLKWDWQTIDTKAVQFPESFMWGTATSAYQIEGTQVAHNRDIANSFTRWERGEIDGKQRTRAGRACNHWDNYKEDIALMAQMGIHAYRFSIGWEKVEPEQGAFDRDAMQHYSDVVDELHKNNITPIVCLFHHSWPVWFDELDAFEKAENIKYFVEFAQFVAENLHGRVHMWIPFNEPVGYALEGYFRGEYPPGKKDLKLCGCVIKNMLDAHVEIFHAFKERDPEALIGTAQVFNPIDPWRTWHPVESFACALFDSLLHDVELNYFKTGQFTWALGFVYGRVSGYNERAIGALDFIGVNYYSNTMLQFHLFEHKKMTTETMPGYVTTDSRKAIYPEGLYRSIERASMLGKPIYIMENGCSDADDVIRDEFIKKHLYVVHKAIKDGFDVRGYFYWSFMDTFNWNSGFSKKYGLVKVDFDSPARTRTIRAGAKSFMHLMQHGAYAQ